MNTRLMRNRKNMRGDTIVEVLLSTALLALALGLAYATSNRSLQRSVDIGNRYQGLAYAQEQAELLKNAATKSPSEIDVYKANPGQPFCIINQDGTPPPLATDAECDQYKSSPGFESPYSLSVVYSSANGLFTVNAKWDSQNSTEPGSTTLYYRPPQPPPGP